MESLGIDGLQLISQIVAFLVIVYLLKRFLYQPFLKVLDDREKRIKTSLENADKLEQRLADLEIKQKKIIKQAREEAAQVIANAEKTAEKSAAKIIETAQRDAHDKLESAVKAIEQEELNAIERIKKQAVLLAEDMTKKTLSQSLDSQTQKAMVERAIKRLKMVKL